jgi:outer membrane protein assembly factor BamB
MPTRTLLLPAACLLAIALPAVCADWPQFRGPHGLGIATEKNLPSTWDAESNIAWKTELPGPGGSSPIVVGDKVFLTCYTGYGLEKDQPGDMKDLKRHLVCLDRRGGKVLWTKVVPAALPETPYQGPYVTLHGYASSTPASDGERVYVFFGKSGVFAFDLEGKQLWQASVGAGTHGWASATSPALHKDLVIVNASVESRSLVALNKSDGKVAWTAKGVENSWSTPLVVSVPKGRDELIVCAPDELKAFDPQTGEKLWSCQFKGNIGYVCASPVAHEGVVYAMRLGGTLAVRAGGKGDVSDSHLLWAINRGSNVTSLVYHDGHLYWADDNGGYVHCATADKGAVVYRQRLAELDRTYASPVAADGKLYYVGREKGAFVLEAGPKFNLVTHNTIKDDPSVFNGSIAVSNGQLLLRSDRYLYCIGKK